MSGGQAYTSQPVGTVEVLEVSPARLLGGVDFARKVELLAYSSGALLVSAGNAHALVPTDKVPEFVKAVRRAQDWQAKSKAENLAFEKTIADLRYRRGFASQGVVLDFQSKAGAEFTAHLILRLSDAENQFSQIVAVATPEQTNALAAALEKVPESIAAAKASAARAEELTRDSTPAATAPAPAAALPARTRARTAEANTARTGKERRAARSASVGGWWTPKPGYPFQAMKMRIGGSGMVRVTTDGTGRVFTASMSPGIHPLIDSTVESFARSSWKGPPNQTRSFPITYP